MIADLILFIAGTVILTVLTIDWKNKDTLEKLQSNALFCGGIITVLQLIILFSKLDSMLSGEPIDIKCTSQADFMLTILVKFRPMLYGLLCKLVISPFTKKSKQFETKVDGEKAAQNSTLSIRETEVARLAIKGYSNAQIAEELFISVETVKRHLSTIFEKQGISSRKEIKL